MSAISTMLIILAMEQNFKCHLYFFSTRKKKKPITIDLNALFNILKYIYDNIST